MISEPMRGVFPILITPFDERDRIDAESLQNLVDYCIAGGVHGFGIAYATEIIGTHGIEHAGHTATIH